MNRTFIISTTLIMVVGTMQDLSAKTWEVSSSSSFNSAYNSAAPGDSIIWTEGVYPDVSMSISKNGLTIMSRTSGRTIFTGYSRVLISGDDNVFSGFQFLNGDIGTGNEVIEIRGSRNHLTQLNIKDYYCEKYLVIIAGCSHNVLSYSNLEHKAYLGDKNVLSVLVSSSSPGYHTIRYCSFKNFDGTGGDMGIEPIRIGLSSQGEYISRTIVEYCYFEQCNGDGEIISNKARQNVFRYNTFYDNPKAELVLRHGDEGVVYGNFFLNGHGGVRVKEGQNHVIFNNYFSGLGSRSIILQNYYVDPLDHVTIAYNTFVNSAKVDLGASGSYPPQNVVFANNIFADPTGSLFTNATGTETWLGNISKGSLGITRPEGIQDTDPMLLKNSEGYYGLSEGSPAIDSSKSGYPSLPDYPDMGIDHEVLLDLMKQIRPSEINLKDVGCSESPRDSLILPPVGSHNTGPKYISDGEMVFLSTSVTGPGSIIADPPGFAYDKGTSVVLTAVADEFSSFLEWGKDLSGNANPDSLIMNEDSHVSASFEPIKDYQITISTVGPGKVESYPSGGIYSAGTWVRLNAIPDPGYLFSHWSGELEGDKNPLDWRVISDLAATANFIADSIPDGIVNNMVNMKSLEFSPNPVSAIVSVSLDIYQAGMIELSVVDLTGKKVKTIHAGRVDPGKQSFEANLRSLKPGIYLLVLKSSHANPILMKLQKI